MLYSSNGVGEFESEKELNKRSGYVYPLLSSPFDLLSSPFSPHPICFSYFIQICILNGRSEVPQQQGTRAPARVQQGSLRDQRAEGQTALQQLQ